MNRFTNGLAIAACAVALSACGGGGSSAGGSNPATGTATGTGGASGGSQADQSWLTFNPPAADITVFEGEPFRFRMIATATRIFEKPFNVAIVDSKGVVAKEVKIQQFVPLQYEAVLSTEPTLPVGTHATRLEVRVCEDDPQVCKVPLPGSPWYIPLSVTVMKATNLTALEQVPGVPAWTTYQGNAAHSGYAPASFDPARFSRRWGYPETGDIAHNNPVAVDNGRAFIAERSSGNWPVFSLRAFSEQTGETVWRKEFNGIEKMSPPAAADGKVYVVVKAGAYKLQVYDQASGQLLAETWVNGFNETYAPVLHGDSVFVGSASGNGTTRVDAATLGTTWQIDRVEESWDWTPAIDGSYVYMYVDSVLQVVGRNDGITAYSIADTGFVTQGGRIGSVALAGPGSAVVVSSDRLVGFDLATRTRAWVIEGEFVGAPAVAKGIVYAVNGSSLEARDLASGKLLWRKGIGMHGSMQARVIVTENLVFVSEQLLTQAIDLATHKTVWSYPAGGSLSISDRGVLYIGGRAGKINAVNLR
ncbi:hypothetical protein EYF70_13195 [Pseudoduganella albidiflava]|uniref:Pyrrolo-quinoline quinone repeat domain-containing protein n=3 Tax=Pseudoduganella albidiflava TaxID=321983 RepID=A0ABX5RSU8_9BURK|nr:PQQ-binding-like beta-propeller repeat protein [Pseudoduganella albidiflava]QBI01697.1 hypothetical protein EYF70_13195 [Pseudoduganella albidiflava]